MRCFNLVGLMIVAQQAAALVVPASPLMQPPAIVRSAVSLNPAAIIPSDASGSIFPASMLIADEEKKMSPAKAKIEAAKAASAAKAQAGGYKTPETKAVSLGLNIVIEEAPTDPFQDYKDIRAKRLALEANGKTSKSKSAQVNQLKTMEAQAREKGNKAVAKAEEAADKEARKAAEKEQKKNAPAGAADDDKFAKVTGISLPKF